MKTAVMICAIGIIMLSCGKRNTMKSQKHQKTPKHMVMTHDEKIDVNYDARENRKVIHENAKNKEANLKAARKQREKQTEELNKLNNTSSKVRRKKTVDSFNFY